VREAANRMQCSNNLKQIGLSMHGFHDARGSFPNSRLDARYTWMVEILPYIEQDSLFKQWNMTSGGFNNQSQAARETPVKTYYCPSRRAPSTTVVIDTMDNTTTPANGVPADYAACTGDPATGAGNDYWCPLARPPDATAYSGCLTTGPPPPRDPTSQGRAWRISPMEPATPSWWARSMCRKPA
jgi:hypothetical protein